MKRIYTSRSLLTLLIFTVFSLFGGGNFLKAQISLTETLTFEDFSGIGAYTGAFSGKLTSSEGVETAGWSKNECMANGSKIQLRASAGKFTSPTITSEAGFTVTITYGCSDQPVTLQVGDDSQSCPSGGSYTSTTRTASLSTTSTSCTISISAGSRVAGVSKIEITPNSSSLAAPKFSLDEGSYTIGEVLKLESPSDAKIVYTVNGGSEMTSEGASVDYRFPTTGNYTITAKSVPSTSELDASEEVSVSYTINENIIPAGVSKEVTLWSETFPSDFTAGDKYLLEASKDGSTYQVTGENLAGGQTVGELLIRKSGGAFVVKSIDLKGMSGVLTLTYQTNNNNSALFTTTSGCTVSDKNYDSNSKKATYTITVPAGTTSLALRIENTASSNTRVDDFLLVSTKPAVGNDYYPFTVSSVGLSTFAAQKAYVIPEGLEGGIVTISPDNADVANVTYLYEAGDVVPAREALLLKGTAGMPYSLEISEQEGTKIDDNLLRPALTYDAISAASGESFYIFANDATGGLGFYFQGADGDGSKVEGIYGKAYLAVSGTNPVRGFRLGGGDVTGIDRIESGVQAAGTSVYTLGGVRVAGSVESLPAGFYIVNGKKVLVK